jgi:hypothetical protein
MANLASRLYASGTYQVPNIIEGTTQSTTYNSPSFFTGSGGSPLLVTDKNNSLPAAINNPAFAFGKNKPFHISFWYKQTGSIDDLAIPGQYIFTTVGKDFGLSSPIGVRIYSYKPYYASPVPIIACQLVYYKNGIATTIEANINNYAGARITNGGSTNFNEWMHIVLEWYQTTTIDNATGLTVNKNWFAGWINGYYSLKAGYVGDIDLGMSSQMYLFGKNATDNLLKNAYIKDLRIITNDAPYSNHLTAALLSTATTGWGIGNYYTVGTYNRSCSIPVPYSPPNINDISTDLGSGVLFPGISNYNFYTGAYYMQGTTTFLLDAKKQYNSANSVWTYANAYDVTGRSTISGTFPTAVEDPLFNLTDSSTANSTIYTLGKPGWASNTAVLFAGAVGVRTDGWGDISTHPSSTVLVPYNNQFDFGNSNYTIEFYANCRDFDTDFATGTSDILFQFDNPAKGTGTTLSNGNTLSLTHSLTWTNSTGGAINGYYRTFQLKIPQTSTVGSFVTTTEGYLTTSNMVYKWFHICVQRISNVYYVYYNGTLLGSITGQTGSDINNANLSIGGPHIRMPQGSPFRGSISNFRVVIGNAVYAQSGFTAPAIALTAVANTKFLTLTTGTATGNTPYAYPVTQTALASSTYTSGGVQAGNTVFLGNQSTAYSTDVGYSTTVTTTGVPQVQLSNPFSAAGFSVRLEANENNTIILNNNLTAGLGLGTPSGSANNFSIEFFIFQKNLSSYARSVSLNGDVIGFYHGTNASLSPSGSTANTVLKIYGGTALVATSGMVENQWNHICAVRTGTTISLFINGIRKAFGTYATQNLNGLYSVSGYGSVGGNSTQDPDYTSDLLIDANISNLRVVKGSTIPYDATQTTLTVPTSKLTAISGTSLLTFQDGYLTDNSGNDVTIAYQDENNKYIVIDEFSPFTSFSSSAYSHFYSSSFLPTFGYHSYLGYTLVVGSYPSLNPGATGAWTFETWVYPVTSAYFYSVGDGGSAYGSAMACGWNGTTFTFLQGNGSTSYPVSITASSNFAGNTWYHYAVSKDASNVIRMFVNGVQVGTQTYSGTIASGTVPFINGLYDNNGAGNGGGTFYISNLRWTKGGALYTTAFTPSTTPLTTTVSSGQCQLLMAQYANPRRIDTGNTSIYPFSYSIVPVQPFSPFSTPSTNNGYSVGYFANNYYQAAASTNWDVFNGDCTVEFFVKIQSYLSYNGGGVGIGNQNNQVFISNSNGTGGWSIVSPNSSESLALLTWNSGTVTATYSSGGTQGYIPKRSWAHIAVCRSGGTIRFYINGMYAGTAAAPTVGAGGKLTSGINVANPSYPGLVSGNISNLRIIKGQALYTATQNIYNIYARLISPPTATIDAPPSIAAKGKGISLSPTSISASTIDEVSIRPTSSAYFSNAGLTPNFNFYTSTLNTPTNFATTGVPFAIEAYVHIPTGGIFNNFDVIHRGYSTSRIAYRLYISSSGVFTFYKQAAASGGGTLTFNSGARTVPTNRWSHVLLTRNANSEFRMFIDGVLVAYTTSTSALSSSGASTNIQDFLSMGYWAGSLTNVYMSNLRITKNSIPTAYVTTSTTLGTSVFTPSTTTLPIETNTSLLMFTNASSITTDLVTNNQFATAYQALQTANSAVYSTYPYKDGVYNSLPIRDESTYANTITMYDYMPGTGATILNVNAPAAGVNTISDTITVVNHTLIAGNKVKYNNQGGASIGNITSGNDYYIVNATTNTFQLSLTSGGAAIDLTANGNSLQTFSLYSTLDRFRANVNATHMLYNTESTPYSVQGASSARLVNAGNTYSFITSSVAANNIVTWNQSNYTFSMETWIQINYKSLGSAQSGYDVIMAQVNDATNLTPTWQFVVDVAGNLCLNWTLAGVNYVIKTVGSTYNSPIVPVGVWTHVGCVMIDGIVNFYINGTLVPSDQVFTTYAAINHDSSSSNTFVIGRTGQSYLKDAYLSNLRTIKDASLPNQYNNQYSIKLQNASTVTENYVSVAASTGLDIGTKDFTLEGFVYLANTIVDSLGNSLYAGGTQTSTTIGYEAGLKSFVTGSNNICNTAMTLFVNNNGTYNTHRTLPMAFTQNTWHHIAITRNSAANTFTTYLDGFPYGYDSANSIGRFSTANLITNANGAKIGGKVYSSTVTSIRQHTYGWPGYISNLRLVNGTSLYNVATTGATANSYSVSFNTGAWDYYANTFSSGGAVTGTPSPKPTLISPANSNFALGAYNDQTQLTVEFFMNPTDVPHGQVAASNTSSASSDKTTSAVFSWQNVATASADLLLYYTTTFNAPNEAGAAGQLILQCTGAGATPTVTLASNIIPINTWSHVAITRDASHRWRLFVNGVQQVLVPNSTTPSTTGYLTDLLTRTSNQFSIGGSTVYTQYLSFPGQISNLRLLRGTALYTSSFTPPSSALTAIANTVFLGLMTTTIDKDYSGLNLNLTSPVTVGTASVYPRLSANNPFNITNNTITVPTAGLTAITNTVLLAAQSSTYVDNSSNNLTLSPANTTYISVWNPMSFVPNKLVTSTGANTSLLLFNSNSSGLPIANTPAKRELLGAVLQTAGDIDEVTINTGIATDGLIIHLDAANTTSYPGTGNTWFDLSGNGSHAFFYPGVVGRTTPPFANTVAGAASYGTGYVWQGYGTVEGVGNFCFNDNNLVPFYFTVPALKQKDFTFEMWIYYASTFHNYPGGPFTGNRFLDSVGGQNAFTITSEHPSYGVRGLIEFYFGGISGVYNAGTYGAFYGVLPRNVLGWNQVVVTKRTIGDTVTYSGYNNGVLQSVANYPNNYYNSVPARVVTNLSAPYVGDYDTFVMGHQAYYSQGILRMYNRAIGTNEVIQNYNANKARYKLP